MNILCVHLTGASLLVVLLRQVRGIRALGLVYLLGEAFLPLGSNLALLFYHLCKLTHQGWILRRQLFHFVQNLNTQTKSIIVSGNKWKRDELVLIFEQIIFCILSLPLLFGEVLRVPIHCFPKCCHQPRATDTK